MLSDRFLIRARGLVKRFGDFTAVDGIDVDVAPGEAFGFLGPNGAGKSSTMRMIGAVSPPTAGELRILGLDPARQAAELRRRIAVVFSNPDAQIIMPTVAEDVAFSLRADRLGREAAAARVAEALERFGLTALADRPSHDLSGGQKQLLALCGAFVRRPELVIADEPTAYLDARNARRVSDHLLEDAGHRLVLVTHELELAARCDTAVLFAGGTVSVTGEPGAVVSAYQELLAEGSLPC